MLPNQKIAVIDDEASIRRALARMLSTEGLEVLEYSTASDFLTADNAESVSCVVSDLRMPGIDGLQLQAVLAERMPHVAIIILTGHADIRAAVAAMRFGAADFLEKPVKRVELLEAIARGSERTRRASAEASEVHRLRELRQPHPAGTRGLRPGGRRSA